MILVLVLECRTSTEYFSTSTKYTEYATSPSHSDTLQAAGRHSHSSLEQDSNLHLVA